MDHLATRSCRFGVVRRGARGIHQGDCMRVFAHVLAAWRALWPPLLAKVAQWKRWPVKVTRGRRMVEEEELLRIATSLRPTADERPQHVPAMA